MKQTLLAILLVPLLVWAIDSINPVTLCDRFVTSVEQKSCQEKIQKMKPDSYLAGLCQHQFEDDSFWQCLEVGQTAKINPKKLEACFPTDLNDADRLSCLRKQIAESKLSDGEFQALRKPATH